MFEAITFEGLGYWPVRQLDSGVWIGFCDMNYTCALCVDLQQWGYGYRYCYERRADAEAALREWDGTGDPPGPWVKLKGHPQRGECIGPGVVDENLVRREPMQAKEWSFVDRSEWGEGPWQGEPDKVQWQDERTGLPCLAVRGPLTGSWCGYVGVPEGHRLYGLDFSRLDVDVHGGLTFAGGCVTEDREHGICHVPDEGEPDHVWWLGFDCAHAFDVSPGLQAHLSRLRAVPGGMLGDVYRDLAYVREQCRGLAEQIRNG